MNKACMSKINQMHVLCIKVIWNNISAANEIA